MRTPSEIRSSKALRSPRCQARARSGVNVVVIDTATRPWGNWKKTNASW